MFIFLKRFAAIIGLIALPLAGCNAIGSGNTINASAFASDATLIVSGLSAVLANPSVVTGLSPKQVVAAQKAITEAEGVIAQINAAGSSVPLPSGQAWMATLSNDASLILPIVASVVALPPEVTAAITAVQVLLPVVQAAVQMVTAGAPAGALMTPAQARLVLGKTK